MKTGFTQKQQSAGFSIFKQCMSVFHPQENPFMLSSVQAVGLSKIPLSRDRVPHLRPAALLQVSPEPLHPGVYIFLGKIQGQEDSNAAAVCLPTWRKINAKCLSLLMTCQNLLVMDCPKVCHKAAVVPRLAEKGSLPHDSWWLHRKFCCCSWEANKGEVNLTPAEEGLGGKIWDRSEICICVDRWRLRLRLLGMRHFFESFQRSYETIQSLIMNLLLSSSLYHEL